MRIGVAAGAVFLCAGPAMAAGIERSTQSVGILFEEGRYASFALSGLSPDLTGTLGPFSSGDMAPAYADFTLGYKTPVGDNLDVALIIGEPVGAAVDYPTGTGYPFAGLTAELTSFDVTGLLRYRFPSNVSVYGGLRLQSVEAELENLPTPGGLYGLSVDASQELGYVAGVAYEKPEIALRVALTYNSAFEHEFDGVESFDAVTLPAASFTTTIPASVNLEFQSGIAENTLAFGSVRWVEWSEFDITPANLGATLIDYQSDYVTYTLGVGRRFNDQWSGAITFGYEPESGDIQGNLAPRDGFASFGIGATYRPGNGLELTGGVTYVLLGDATTQTIGGEFEDNSGIGAGFRIAYRY